MSGQPQTTVTTLTDEDRRILALIANTMLPGIPSVPSATEADVAGTGVDRVLAARPDLGAPLKAALADISNLSDIIDLGEIIQENPVRWDTIAFVVAGAFYSDPSVKTAIGYPGQIARPLSGNELEKLVNSEILVPVLNRGPVYRSTGEAND